MVLYPAPNHPPNVSSLTIPKYSTNRDSTLHYVLNRTRKVGDYYARTKEQLSERLKENIILTVHKYTKRFFHYSFIPHLKSELPEELKTKGIWDIVKEQPYELIGILGILAARKTFKGTCPVCKDW